MSRESLIIITGDNTPDDVIVELNKFDDGSPSMTFTWDDEDNEDMPATAKYLSEKYNTYHCTIINHIRTVTNENSSS